MGKECPECRLVEEEYALASAEELTHAVMHVENAVNNLRANCAAALRREG